MSVNSAKNGFPVHRGCKWALLAGYIYIKGGDSVVFFICSKRYVDITRIYVTLETS